LLAQAGFRDANPLTLQLLFPAKHYGQSFDEMTPAVAEMLKDVGVQVTLKLMIDA
jgi:ABC-type transport system substrate-binding protein